MTRRFPWLGACAAAPFGLLMCAWLFYPGFVSFDTAHQWYQVRHGEYSNHHPPLMALMWSLTEPVMPGPGGLFLLHALLYWGALAALAGTLFRRHRAQAAAVLIVGLSPPLFGLMTHVLKDVALLAWLMAASAVLVVERQRRAGSRPLLLLAGLLVTVAAALRHNGLAAAVPLVFWMAWRWQAPAARRPVRVLLTGGVALVVLVLLAQLPDRHPRVERVQFWPTLALWDLAAVSVAEDRVLIPAVLQKRPLTVADLRAHFDPSVNVPLFAPDLIRVSLIEPYSDQELAQLRQAWLALPWHFPRSYFGHRWRLSRAMIGLPGAGMPRPQDLMPGYTALADNPPVVVPALPGRTAAVGALTALSGSVWLAAWPWLLGSLLVSAVLWRQRRRPLAPLGLVLVASAWCYALPLVVFAASSELRYLSWTLGAIAVAALIAAAGVRGDVE